MSEHRVQRRVAGYHDIRMDGMTDLVIRARDRRVMDIGCNRGLVGFEMANNGAAMVHGCDIYAEGIAAAREIFADLRSVKSQFEVVDLRKGPKAFAAFNGQQYDITLMLATYHKLKRVMMPQDLTALVGYIASITTMYFAWRGTSEKASENEGEMAALDQCLRPLGLKRVHTSYLSTELGVAAIWNRC